MSDIEDRSKAIGTIRDDLRELGLEESDLSNKDLSDKLGVVKGSIDSLETVLGDSEPWLIEWLQAEHIRGGILFGAVKANWNKNRNDGEDRMPFDLENRAVKIDRFNAWWAGVSHRLTSYERSTPIRHIVAPWTKDATAFNRNPVKFKNQ